MAKAELTRAALSQYPHTGTDLFDLIVPSYRAAPLYGHHYDDGNDDGIQLLHKGHLLTGLGRSTATAAAAQRFRTAVSLINAHFASNPAEGFTEADSTERARIYRHSAASIGGREQLTSRAHSRSSRSPASFALADVMGRQLIVDISHYLRVVSAASGPSAQTLRLAVCSAFNPTAATSVFFSADTSVREFNGNDIAIHVSDFIAPLACSRTASDRVPGSHRLWLARFGNCSRLYYPSESVLQHG